MRVWGKPITHFHNHHVEIKSATTAGFRGTVDATADLGYDGAADGHIRYEVTVHNVDVQPIGALFHLLGAVMAQIGEVGAENGGSDDSGRCHDVYVCVGSGVKGLERSLEGWRGYKRKKR